MIRIGMLTSGGDCQALNAAMRGVAKTLYNAKEDVEIYEEIKRQADKVVYTSEEYTKGCMHKRNRYLVDNSSVCIAYLTEAKGGTAYTVDYALKHNLTVYNVAELI